MQSDERREDLYQCLMAFFEDNLLIKDGLNHHGIPLDEDEGMSPSLDNIVVRCWLQLVHPSLPHLVKQRYGTELRSRIPASIKPENSQALDSLQDEVHTSADAKAFQAATSSFQRQRTVWPPQTRLDPITPPSHAHDRYHAHYASKRDDQTDIFLANVVFYQIKTANI